MTLLMGWSVFIKIIILLVKIMRKKVSFVSSKKKVSFVVFIIANCIFLLTKIFCRLFLKDSFFFKFRFFKKKYLKNKLIVMVRDIDEGEEMLRTQIQN